MPNSKLLPAGKNLPIIPFPSSFSSLPSPFIPMQRNALKLPFLFVAVPPMQSDTHSIWGASTSPPVFLQIYPKEIPCLVAFRPHAGNWRFTWHIVDNKVRCQRSRRFTVRALY
jgi:hypothetical protein